MSTRLDVTGYGAEDTHRLRLGAVEATRAADVRRVGDGFELVVDVGTRADVSVEVAGEVTREQLATLRDEIDAALDEPSE